MIDQWRTRIAKSLFDVHQDGNESAAQNENFYPPVHMVLIMAQTLRVNNSQWAGISISYYLEVGVGLRWWSFQRCR